MQLNNKICYIWKDYKEQKKMNYIPKSKGDNAVLIAIEKGYYIDHNGDCFNKKNNLMRLYLNNTGYLRFNVKINSKVYPVMVHKLQAYFKFKYEIFKNGLMVRHLNGNPLDNSFDNILMGTSSENQMDIPKEIRVERSRFSNLKHNHNEIIQDRKSGMSYKEIMEKYSINSKGTISFIINKSLDSAA